MANSLAIIEGDDTINTGKMMHRLVPSCLVARSSYHGISELARACFVLVLRFLADGRSLCSRRRRSLFMVLGRMRTEPGSDEASSALEPTSSNPPAKLTSLKENDMPRSNHPRKKSPVRPPTDAVSLQHGIEIDSIQLPIALRGENGEVFVGVSVVTALETLTRTPLGLHLSTGPRELGDRG